MGPLRRRRAAPRSLLRLPSLGPPFRRPLLPRLLPGLGLPYCRLRLHLLLVLGQARGRGSELSGGTDWPPRFQF